MNISAVVLAAAAPAPAVMMDASRPTLDFSCSLRDVAKAEYELDLRVSGGRMIYQAGKLAGYTPRTITVQRDSAGITRRFPDQYVNMAREYDANFEATFGWNETGSFRGGLNFQTHGIGFNGRAVRVASLDDGYSGKFKAGGLCTVTEVAQTALQEGPASQ